jgi:hypothetical protein
MAIACGIGGKNGDEFSLERRRFHLDFLLAHREIAQIAFSSEGASWVAR